ncbi:RNA polymerase sigma factor [Colwellia psychrerythraea]|uniref:RNA polymerase, sigma-24 subunit, RpoE, ECF subfamily n=1 Tax=Colwellia psychrerythraea TaxID=28229 RepID=A0A099KZ87_COLPS|nr:RNA polymerase sigma factor [Colwellia psychrerythraea]KGJ95926.1 RNA polymerase, sigma-24 subunit, RpoE, ECF subfamily [Colwellia psychrerythraea]
MNSVFKGKLDSNIKVEPFKNQDLSKPSDKILIDQFLNGSRGSYEEIVQRYKERIFGFIYFQVKQHKHDAEDLTQEVFIELYKKAAHFRNESKFSTYLFSIAKNIVLNYFRSSSRRFSLYKIFHKGEEEKAINLQEQYLFEVDQKQVVLALNRLPVDERQIIYLCDKEDFSYLQISEILNIKVGTVRSRLSTARKKVISSLREDNHEM